MWISSFKLILKQNWITYFLLSLVGLGGAWLVFFIYPGEEGVYSLVSLAENAFAELFFGEVIQNLDSPNSAFFLWFIFLFFIAYASNLYPVIGIWLGGSGTSEEAKSGMGDLFLASSNRKITLPLRHILTHIITITCITVIIFINIPLSLGIADKAINYERVFNGFLLLWISFITFYSISFFFSHLTLKSEIGRGISTLIFLLSFVIQSIVGTNTNLEFLQDFNLLHYTNASPVLLLGTNLTFDNFLPLILAIILMILGLLVLQYRDLIPLSLNLRYKGKVNSPITPFSRLKRGRESEHFIRDYFEVLLKRISPISAEQWVADRMIFFVFFIACLFSVFSIIIGYPTGEGGYPEMVLIYKNNPIVTAIIRGSLDSIIDDPLGPLYTQYYGYNWLYFFPLVIIAAIRIADRDNKDQSIDLLYANPVTSKNLIFPRVITVVFEITLLSLMNVIVLILGEFYLNIESRLLEQILTIFLVPFAYGSILCLFVAISILVPRPVYRRRIMILLGSISLVFVLLPYFSKPLFPLRFLTPLYYLDLVGLITQSFTGEPLVLLLVLIGILVISVSIISKYANKQVLT